MTVLEKSRLWLRQNARDEEHYKEMLGKMYINPNHRNTECPYAHSCGDCSKNHFRIR